MWVVKLLRNPTQNNNYPANFFPRRVYYKKDAEKLKEEVYCKGGLARVEKEEKKK